MPFSPHWQLPTAPPLFTSTPPVRTFGQAPSLRATLERLYESTYGCPPPADAELVEQAAYLRFVLPSPASLDAVAVVLAAEEVG